MVFISLIALIFSNIYLDGLNHMLGFSAQPWGLHVKISFACCALFRKHVTSLESPSFVALDFVTSSSSVEPPFSGIASNNAYLATGVLYQV